MKKIIIYMFMVFLLISTSFAYEIEQGTTRNLEPFTVRIYDNSFFDRLAFSILKQDYVVYTDPSPVVPGDTIDIQFDIHQMYCYPDSVLGTAKVMIMKNGIMWDYLTTDVSQYPCDDLPVNWMVSYTIPSDIDTSATWTITVQIKDNRGREVGSETGSLIIQSTPTDCPDDFCENPEFYGSTSNGLWYSETCYDYPSSPPCTDYTIYSGSTSTQCNTGYVCEGTDQQECPGLKSCVLPTQPGEEETCFDGIQNQGETGVDCGGPCQACTTTPPVTAGNIKITSLIIPSSIEIEQPTLNDIKVTVKNEGSSPAHAFFKLGIYTEDWATQQGYTNNLLGAIISLYGTGTGCAKESFESWGELDLEAGEESELFVQLQTKVYPALNIPVTYTKFLDGTSNYDPEGNYVVTAGIYTNEDTCEYDHLVAKKITIGGELRECETAKDCNTGEQCNLQGVCLFASEQALCGQECTLIGDESGPQSSCITGWCWDNQWPSPNLCEPMGFDSEAFKTLSSVEQSSVKDGVCASAYWTIPDQTTKCPSTWSTQCIPEGCTYQSDPLVVQQECCEGLVKEKTGSSVGGLLETGICVKSSDTKICGALEPINILGDSVPCGGGITLAGGIFLLFFLMQALKGPRY